MKCIFPFIKGLSIHGNLITHMRASVPCCIHSIGHNDAMNTREHTYAHTNTHTLPFEGRKYTAPIAWQSITLPLHHASSSYTHMFMFLCVCPRADINVSTCKL